MEVDNLNDFLAVGQIINTHGIKGELKIYPLTDDIRRFRKLKTVIVDGNEMNISWCKLQNDRVIIKLEGIDSIEQGEKLKTKYLEVKREDAVKLPEDTYFIADLVGCEVYDSNEEYVGKVFEIIKTGSNDVYWIKNNKKEVLVPAMKEFVTDIDISSKKIIIRPVGEWMDED